MEGYTEIVKLAESALNGDSEKSKVWINKFIEKYPNSKLIKPFKALLIGDKNPDKLRCDGETSDEHSNCNKPLVSGSAFVIMYQKKPLKNILFQNCDLARNYIKMQNPTRTFNEPEENVFVCSRYGTTFQIVELHYR